MKQITLLLATSALLFSCRKTECTPPPTNKPTLVGCWLGEYGSSICFTDSLISKDTEPFYPYRIYKDTIHIGLLIEMYKFEILNDTLIIKNVRLFFTDTFYRNI